MILHTFGDSHASHIHGGWNNEKMNLPVQIISNHLGPKLMHSFGRDKNYLFSHNTVSEGDIVVFCFGEIDCRCHVGKYSPNWKPVIDTLVENYFEAIRINAEQYKDLTITVYNVVPQIERESPKNAWMIPYQANAPHVGADSERAEYTRYMNKRLASKCEESGYIFIDVYDKYCDENGFLREELSDKNCHISDPKYVSEFIISNLWGAEG
ncbi:MAG: hypothetical protein HOE32_04475 [Nitrospina sp.]|jgi:hypothetical protein|nr:hypothetical protein [Nitrospina sp.]